MKFGLPLPPNKVFNWDSPEWVFVQSEFWSSYGQTDRKQYIGAYCAYASALVDKDFSCRLGGSRCQVIVDLSGEN